MHPKAGVRGNGEEMQSEELVTIEAANVRDKAMSIAAREGDICDLLCDGG
jgi:hypothetical protein